VYLAKSALGTFTKITDISPTLKEKHIILKGLTLMFKMPKNGIFFCGTFDPWHRGHTACLAACQKGVKRKKIVVAPDYSPLKKRPQNFWKKFIDIHLHLKNGPYLLYPGFVGLSAPNPTYRWLKKVEGEKNLLMGDDNFVSITNWKDADKLLKIIDNIYVVPRNNESKMAYMVKYLKRYRLRVILLGRHKYAGISSTKIRRSYVRTQSVEKYTTS
jgi:nicotinic acid mononucleotide adenylyltransferase